MLSILIPTFNYDVYSLVKELHDQCIEAQISFEIIVRDDASQKFHEENSRVNSLSNTSFKILEKNIGRTAIRNYLASMASYENLLFLDADVIPKEKSFIKKYISYLGKNMVVFGGCAYKDISFTPSTSLRFNYGKSREEQTASDRNKVPYSYVFSGNFFINKQQFIRLNIPEDNIYGMDIFFSYLLFKNKYRIVHIDNPIYHLGLEDNTVFLTKSLQSVVYRADKWMYIEEIVSINSLLKWYKKFNFFPLNKLCKLLFIVTKKKLEKGILAEKSNLTYFDIYRLLYLFYYKN